MTIKNTGVTLTDLTTRPATPTTGSLVIKHTTSAGSSSIIFPSVQNYGSDYAFLEYNEDTTGGGEEKGLGIQNDTKGCLYQDYLHFYSSGRAGEPQRCNNIPNLRF